MAELIPVGNDDASSADIPVVAGTPVTIFLKTDADGQVPVDAVAVVQAKAGDVYNTFGRLDFYNSCQVVDATMTIRVRRPGGTAVFGVEQGE